MALINCKECGQQISDSATFCPHCGAPVSKDVFCPECGTKVPEGDSFCPNCGRKLDTPVQTPVQAQTPAGDGNGTKDKTVAGILAIVLGSLGIHYFYLGKVTAGILTIILSCCTCGIWSLLMFIQGIMMLVMSDKEFREKYVDNDRTLPLF